MTKLLVLSDSHGARGAIERILNKEQNNVDAVIFLGDGLDRKSVGRERV